MTMLLVEATLKLSAVLAAGFAAAALLRSRPAALRHWVLAAAILSASAAPALGVVAPAWHLGLAWPAPAAAPGPATANGVVARPAGSAIAVEARIAMPRATEASRARSAGTLVAIAWLAGAIASVLTLLIGVARLIWIDAHADAVTEAAWTDAMPLVAREQGVSSRIALLATDHPSLLVTWGVVAPTILIPRAALAWPADRIRVVLRHEIAHIRRRDWLVQMGAEIVRAIHWFNPLAWIACRRIRQESEHACDDAVLRLGVDGSEYASHLLDLARSMNTRQRAWVPAQAMVRPSSLERRITAMLNARLDRKPVSRTSRIVSTTAMIAVAIAVAGFAASAQTSGVLSGTVSNQLGEMLPNAPVTLTSLDDGSKRQATSNDLGQYEFVGVPAGDYILGVTRLPGFTPAEVRVVVNGGSLERNLQLHIGAIHETIRVTEGGPALPPPLRRDQRKLRDDVADGCSGNPGCIAPPLKLSDHKPIFPDSQKGVGGVVQLKGIIDTTGHVGKLQVVGDANADLAQSAIDAVSLWEFEPTRLNGTVIETELNVSVTFSSSR